VSDATPGKGPRKRSREKKQRPLRLFVAVYPPPELAAAMQAASDAPGLPPHRAVPVEQIHLTLLFIGDTDPKALDRAKESVELAAKGIEAFELTPTRLISLPEKKPPRLIAAETDAPPPLLELHRRLARSLLPSPRKDPADRYRPHMTLRRFRDAAAGFRIDPALDVEPFAVDRICLMRSVLRPEGAEHREVLAVPLGL